MMTAMEPKGPRNLPGQVRDAILQALARAPRPLSVREIEGQVQKITGPTPPSSVRSYLRLNTPDLFVRDGRGVYGLRTRSTTGVQQEFVPARQWEPPFHYGRSRLIHADCFD